MGSSGPASLRLGRLAALLALAGIGVGAGCSRQAPPPSPGGVPEEVVRHNLRGVALLGQGKWPEARGEFEAGLAARPGDPVLLANAGIALVQENRLEEARARFAAAVAKDAGSLHGHYGLALLDRDQGDFESTREHLEVVTRLDPEDVTARYQLASALTRLNRGADAEREFRAALAREPGHVSALYGLGRLLLQSGREAEGTGLINRSQEIRTRSGQSEIVGTQYGEQGPYGMGALYPAGGLAAPAAIPVRLRELTKLAAQGTPAAGVLREGGKPELIVMGADGLQAVELGGAVRRIGPAPPEGSRVLALAVGDLDGDRRLEGAALLASPAGVEARLLGWQAGGSLAWREPAAGAATPLAAEPTDGALALVDLDHDGDLDLLWCWGGPDPGAGAEGASGSRCRLAINDGRGQLAVADPGPGIRPGAPGPGPIRIAFSDLDNHRDIDLVVAEPAGLRVYLNRREAGFEDVSAKLGLGEAVPGVEAVQVADLDKDGWMDLVLATPAGPRLVPNRRGRLGAPAPVGGAAAAVPAGSAGAVVLDLDNDGFLDLAVAPGRLLRNLGGAFEELKDAFPPGAFTPLLAFDGDGDGDLDLVARNADGGLALLVNDGGNRNHWIEVSLKGVGDNRLGVGTRLTGLAGGLSQKLEVTGPLPVHLGLGARRGLDAVELLWPGGVLQYELDLPGGQVREVAQLDRKGTSCPILYAWRGGRYEFVSDFLGGSAIGYRHGSGELSVPDTDEYVHLEGGLDAEGGRLRVRLNNQLEEVIFFDHASLVAVDHPAGTQVFANERLMPGPPWPEPRFHASADVRPVAGARDLAGGADLGRELAERDRVYVENFGRLAWKGYAEPHGLELDLGPLPRGARVVLLLDGWIDYADSTSNRAASQAGVRLEPPRLEVADGRGGFLEVPGRMGFPAGLPKTMAVDLSGAFPASDHRLRITTSMRIYWDRARVLVGGESTPLKVRRLEAVRAELRFGGFPEQTSPDGRPPFGYDPGRVRPGAAWKAHVGAYTPFGDVRELLVRVDDRLVVTRSGDEIELEFAAPPEPPRGWVRDWFLYADGFGKDMDPSSAASQRVGPMPFHAMPVYPYGAGVVPPVDSFAGLGRPARVVPQAEDGIPGVIGSW